MPPGTRAPRASGGKRRGDVSRELSGDAPRSSLKLAVRTQLPVPQPERTRGSGTKQHGLLDFY